MAQLVVRNLPEDLVRALKLRAAKHNRSAEQEHREILEAALRGPRRRSLAAVWRPCPTSVAMRTLPVIRSIPATDHVPDRH